MYLLDADIVNQVFRENPVVLRRIEEHPDDVWISVVTIEEVMQGALAAINAARTTKRDVRVGYHLLYSVFEVMKDFRVLCYTDEAHRTYTRFTSTQLLRERTTAVMPPLPLHMTALS